jgi:hypothetical protein
VYALSGPRFSSQEAVIAMRDKRISLVLLVGMAVGVLWACSAGCQSLSAGSPAVVTIDETGAMRVDGKLFFPIGLYQVPYWDMADVEAHGFNIVDEIQPVSHYLDRTFLDAAYQNGLKVRVAIFSGFGWWNSDHGPWEPTMRDALDWAFFKDYPGDHLSPKHHPATVMWYLEDEPRFAEPPIEPYFSNLRAAHDHIHSMDPAHPDMTCLYNADFENRDAEARLAQFRAWSFPDVVAVDCYPLGSPPVPNPYDAPLTAVARWMGDLVTALTIEGRHASPQVVLEAFQFGGWRMPSRDQLRLMAYLAVIHGAKGVWYFCYGGAERDGQPYGPGPGLHDFPEVWAYVGELNAELAALADAILSPPVLVSAAVSTTGLVVQDRYGYSPIHHIVRHHDGWTYVLAANGSETREHEATFALPVSGAIGAIDVMFEGRTILTSGATFTDRFAPMAVHVYRWRDS